MDYTISHYTDDELLELLEVDRPSHASIAAAALDKQQRHAADADLSRFFADAAARLSKLYPLNTRSATRLITVDSAFRDHRAKADPDNFTFLLAEPLHHVTSISLHSVELLKTWYNFAASKGNTGAVVQTLDSSGAVQTFAATVPDGDYTPTALVAAVVLALNAACDPLTPFSASVDPANHRVTLNAVFPRTAKLTFYDPTTSLPSLVLARANKNLGHSLGFREPFLVFEPSTSAITAPSPVVATSSRYVQMRLDDFCPARFNNSTVQIGIPDNRFRPPPSSETLFRKGTGDLAVQLSAPRRLTSKQLFALNAAASTSTDRTHYDEPNTDIFAKIPLKHLDCVDFGKVIVEFSGPLQQNTRDYFNPIILTSMAVSLYDDKNNLLGLNGCDWSFSLLVKQLV